MFNIETFPNIEIEETEPLHNDTPAEEAPVVALLIIKSPPIVFPKEL